jgi:hypothetical protein
MGHPDLAASRGHLAAGTNGRRRAWEAGNAATRPWGTSGVPGNGGQAEGSPPSHGAGHGVGGEEPQTEPFHTLPDGNGRASRTQPGEHDDPHHGSQEDTPVPAMFLVKELQCGAVIVQGYPSGESVYVGAEESYALRAALAAAVHLFGRSMDVPPLVRPRMG